MKVAKLSIGIVSLVLSMVVMFQSCAAGLGNALTDNTSDTSGSTGMFLVILLIAAGIVAIAGRKSKGGAIAAAILYGLSGIIGVTATGTFKDLMVWGVICIIFALVFVISIFVQDFSKSKSKSKAVAE